MLRGNGLDVVAMRRLHGADDEPRAGDEQEGVERAEVAVERLLVEVEFLDMAGPGEGVGRKEHREGEQFGEDEEPDGEVAGQALLRCFGRISAAAVMAHILSASASRRNLMWPKNEKRRRSCDPRLEYYLEETA